MQKLAKHLRTSRTRSSRLVKLNQTKRSSRTRKSESVMTRTLLLKLEQNVLRVLLSETENVTLSVLQRTHLRKRLLHLIVRSRLVKTF
jgi:hypothetical protein